MLIMAIASPRKCNYMPRPVLWYSTPNPRGSTGYGEEFGNLLYHDYPGDDYHDVMDGVDAMLERNYITEDSLFVTGGSAGGIMTAWMIGKKQPFPGSGSN